MTRVESAVTSASVAVARRARSQMVRHASVYDGPQLSGVEWRLEETLVLLVASEKIGDEVEALQQNRPDDRSVSGEWPRHSA